MIKSPGSIRSKNEITIQLSTYCGIRLFHGRVKTEKRRGIMGVTGFSKYLNTIERAIKLDDPYADHHFMLIEEAIENLKFEFEKMHSELEHYIQSNTPGMDLSRSVSSEPSIVTLNFASKMSFKLVFQIMKADEIVLTILQANHIGLMPNVEKFKMIAEIERNVRAVVGHVFNYKYTGVTRDDIAAKNKRAEIAFEAMGELEKEILEGSKRSSEAPNLPHKRAKQVKQISEPLKVGNDEAIIIDTDDCENLVELEESVGAVA